MESLLYNLLLFIKPTICLDISSNYSNSIIKYLKNINKKSTYYYLKNTQITFKIPESTNNNKYIEIQNVNTLNDVTLFDLIIINNDYSCSLTINFINKFYNKLSENGVIILYNIYGINNTIKTYKTKISDFCDTLLKQNVAEISNYISSNSEQSITIIKKKSKLYFYKDSDILKNIAEDTNDPENIIKSNQIINSNKDLYERIKHLFKLIIYYPNETHHKINYCNILNKLGNIELNSLHTDYLLKAKYYLETFIIPNYIDEKKFILYGDILYHLKDEECLTIYRLYLKKILHKTNQFNIPLQEKNTYIYNCRYCYHRIITYYQNISKLTLKDKIIEEAIDNKMWKYKSQRAFDEYIPDVKSEPFLDPNIINFKDYLENHSNIIKEEYINVKNKLDNNVLFEWENQFLTEEDKTWKEIQIGIGHKFRKYFPNTVKILNDIHTKFGLHLQKNHSSVKFSVLSPKMHIIPHCGNLNTRVRIHLGIIIPKGCYIRCDNEINTWEEGKIIVLDDSYEHEVWHWGDTERVILIIDIWNPNISLEYKNKIIEGRKHYAKGLNKILN